MKFFNCAGNCKPWKVKMCNGLQSINEDLYCFDKDLVAFEMQYLFEGVYLCLEEHVMFL